jgi:hypothetical protein
VPPMHSALKRDGVPLYKLARRGEPAPGPHRGAGGAQVRAAAARAEGSLQQGNLRPHARRGHRRRARHRGASRRPAPHGVGPLQAGRRDRPCRPRSPAGAGPRRSPAAPRVATRAAAARRAGRRAGGEVEKWSGRAGRPPSGGRLRRLWPRRRPDRPGTRRGGQFAAPEAHAST